MKAIIFDFDGTIADSFEVFLEAVRTLAPGSRELTKADIEELRRYSTKIVIQRLGIRPWQIPRLLVKGRLEITARMGQVKPFDGFPEVLAELAAHYRLYILSTNSVINISTFLAKYGLESYITQIYGNIGIMGKAQSLRKLMIKEGFAPTDCVYVGDETRDIEAAKKVGLKCIAVSWGFNHPDALRAFAPDVLADAPASLPGIAARLSAPGASPK